MALPSLQDEPFRNPLTLMHGVWRVGGTRVTLVTVLHCFNEGAGAEEIAFRFPSLKLSDIYATIALYLQHKDAFDVYVSEHEREAEELRREIAERPEVIEMRKRLMRRAQEKGLA